MNFAQPQYIWMLLAALPLAAGLFLWSWRIQQKLVARFVQSRLLPTLTIGVSPGRRKFRLALLLAGLAGVFVALARPQWGSVWEEATQRGLDIIVAIDTSRSMLATDAQPSRLEKAKLAAYDLMRQSKQDRLGLIAFAGDAFLQSPLTLDDEAFRQNVEALQVGIVPQGGTAISQAIRASLKAFEKGNDNHKVLVLFTDGEDHDTDTDTLAAAEEAAKAGLRIFTVGVGTASGELIRVTDDQGNQTFLKDEDGNVVKSHLNEALLEQIATATGGFYIPLRGADPMQVLYSRGLAPLPKSTEKTQLTRVARERYGWPLGFAVVCLLLEFMLPEMAPPRRKETAGAPAVAALRKTAAILFLLAIPGTARASTPGAYDKYKSGDYQGAYEEYNRLAGENTNDYRLHYNAGTAAYRANQLDAAEKQLTAALNTPGIASDLDTEERTYFNLGNTQFHLGEPATDPQKKTERWQQSIANYSRALELNTNDTDARSNLAFVKKKLEELRQQQQQQKQNQQQQNQQDQKNNQQQNQQQQKGDQKDQQRNSAQQQQKDKQDQQQAQKSDPDKQGEDQKQQQAQAQQKDQDQRQKPGQAKVAGDDQRGDSPEQSQEMASAVPVQMTQQEARQMLDAEKDDEKALIFSPENKQSKPVAGKTKDW